jgi:hypothetical protein
MLILFLMSVCFGQTLNVGDTLPSGLGFSWCGNNGALGQYDSLFFDDFNGATNDRGVYSVIWIQLFTSW